MHKTADLKLDEGLSDMHKPYYPDFGYPQMEIEEKKNGWNLVADSIIHYPKYMFIKNFMESKSKPNLI